MPLHTIDSEASTRFFELSQDLFCIATPDGYFEHLNRSWERVLGYPLEDLYAQPYFNLVHADDVEATAVAAADLATRPVIQFENRYRAADGSYRWLSWNSSTYADGRTYAIARDITAAKNQSDSLSRQATLIDLSRHIATIANAAESFDDCMNDVLKAVCGQTYWDAGHAYTWDQESSRYVSRAWHVERHHQQFIALQQISARTTFERDLGTVGATLRSGSALWITDLHDADNFIRRSGLGSVKTGLFVPISNRSQVVGVLEFFSRDRRDQEAAMSATVAGASEQLGVVAERDALVRALGRQASLIDAAHDAFIVRDLDSRITFWSNGAERTYGWPCDDVLGRVTHDLFDTNSQRNTHEIEREVQQSGHWNGELHHRRADGSEIVVESRWSLERDPSGNPTGYLEINRDVTDRRKAEDAVHRSEQRLKGIIDNSSAAIYVKDLTGRYLLVNQQFDKIFDLDAGWVIGRRDHEFLPEEIADGVSANDAQVRETGTVLRTQETVRHADGGLHAYISVKFPLVDTDGTTYGVCGISTDITELETAREQLARQTQELSRSNEELEQFAYVASHDLQEPLRMVSSYVQLLERRYGEKLDDDARDFIGYAVDGANRMQALIQDLLAYARVHSRGQDFSFIDASVAAERAIENTSAAAQEADAELHVGPLPVVAADPGQLVQLFQNLLSNAIKFRKDGRPPRIEISAKRDGEMWLFQVADDGIGIDPEYAARIFLIFQRLNKRVDYSGTGIGLAICKRIIDRHGGRIWVESEVGSGSTFFFTLPAVEKGEG